MVEVKIPFDVREYKGKYLIGFNLRQLLSLITAAVVGVSIGYFASGHVSQDALLWLIIIAVSPICAWGWAKPKGMNFERFLKVYYNYRVCPQFRIYEDTRTVCYRETLDEVRGNEIRQQRIDNGEVFFEDDDYDDDMEVR
jgi:hypothetical protein